MFPILAHIGSVNFYSYGVLIAVGVIVSSFVVWKQARVRGLSEERIFDSFILSLFGAIAASRAIFVALNWDFFKADVGRIILFLKYPGFSYEGAVLGAVILAILSSWSYGLSVLEILDIFALSAAIGSVFGAAGCFLDGCSGSISAYPVFFGVGSFLLALILSFLVGYSQKSVALSRFQKRPGMVFLCYLIFQSVSILIASWRLQHFLPNAQLVILLAAVFLFCVRYREIFLMVKFPKNVLTQINKYLEGRRDDIEHRLSELKKQDPYEDKSRLLDMASDDAEAHNKASHERVAALQRQLNIALIQTRKALTKVKIGKYGICENCGKMIDTDRLSVMPMATLCLSCEKKRER